MYINSKINFIIIYNQCESFIYLDLIIKNKIYLLYTQINMSSSFL
jgi:hypothetical protein